LRQRKGITRREAETFWHDRTSLAAMMVYRGEAEALVAGLTQHYPDTIRPALQVIPMKTGRRKVAGMYLLITPHGKVFSWPTRR